MEYKLGEIATFSQGKQVDINEQYDYKKDNMKRFLRIVDYTNTNEPIRFVEDYGKKYYVSENDLIMIRYGSQTAGKVVMGKSGIIANNMFKINLNKNIVVNRYMYYYLSQKNIYNYLKNSQSSSTMPAISFSMLDNLIVNLPPISTQKKVVNILDNFDKKIELNNQINDNLHNLAEQQFIKIYKTGEEKTLDNLLDNVSTGSRPKGGAQSEGIPSIGAEKIEKFGVYDYSSEKYISENFYEKLKNGKVKSGDVLLYKDGAYTGKVSMCLNGFPHNKSAVNEHVFILNTKNNWAQNYLYFTIYNKENREMLERIASSKAAQPGLNQTELKSLKINICNKETIENFEINVKPIMENIANNSLENKKLSKLRDTLLPKLMNGEIDIDKVEI